MHPSGVDVKVSSLEHLIREIVRLRYSAASSALLNALSNTTEARHFPFFICSPWYRLFAAPLFFRVTVEANAMVAPRGERALRGIRRTVGLNNGSWVRR